MIVLGFILILNGHAITGTDLSGVTRFFLCSVSPSLKKACDRIARKLGVVILLCCRSSCSHP